MYKVLLVTIIQNGKTNDNTDKIEKLLNGGWEIHHSQTISGGGAAACLMVLKKDNP